MRRWQRAVARQRMKLLGYGRINRKRYDIRGFRHKSVFAERWREVLSLNADYNKDGAIVIQRKGMKRKQKRKRRA